MQAPRDTSKVLFLCTGNYYRSRYAEAFFNHWAGERQLAWRAESRGFLLVPENVGFLSSHALARLQKQGIVHESYQRLPRLVTRDDLNAAAHVVAVKETEHRPMVAERFPDWLARIEFWEVHDLDAATPDETLAHLEREVTRLLDRLVRAGSAKQQEGRSGAGQGQRDC